MRLAMVLLGVGEREDLACVLGGVSEELLAGIRLDAPLFGVNRRLDAFSCLRADCADALRMSAPRLGMACSLFPDVAQACARRLCERGEHGRSALVCGLPGMAALRDSVAPWGASFLDAGETQLVGGMTLSHPSCGREEPNGDFSRELARAHTALTCKVPGTDALLEAEGLEKGDGPLREALLLTQARLVLRGSLLAGTHSGDGWSPLARRLLVHAQSCALMCRGNNASAVRLLVSNGASGAKETVSAALACLDLEMARLLMGDGPPHDAAEVDCAEAFLGTPKLEGLRGYPLCVQLVRALVSGDEGGASLADSLIARAERRGDVLVQVAGLVVGTIYDLRRGATTRASVRAALAAEFSHELRLAYPARIARLLGDVARFSMGEGTPIPRREVRNDDLGAVCALVAEATSCEAGLEGAFLPEARAPRDALWLLQALSEGMGEFSSLVRERTPPEWRQALATAGAVWRAGRAALGSVPASMAAPADGAGAGRLQAPIEVTLLGGFSVRVRGVEIPDNVLERRNTKSVMEYLLLQRGGEAKRYRLVEQVWPDCDYSAGFSRAYKAASELRSAVHSVDPEIEPFLRSRTSRALALNMGLFHTDVDDLVRWAREAADSSDDSRSVLMARRAEKIYAGDLYIPPMDATGFVSAMREHLRVLYVDAMVAGADAALRLGQHRTAARLATNAVSVDDLREDAVAALVQALKASGRNIEADRQYRRYARRLVQEGNHAPSRQLRRAASGEAAGE